MIMTCCAAMLSCNELLCSFHQRTVTHKLLHTYNCYLFITFSICQILQKCKVPDTAKQTRALSSQHPAAICPG